MNHSSHAPPRATASNLLLDRLHPSARDHVIGLCEPVAFAPGAVVCQAEQPHDHAYFPLSGFIAMEQPLVGHPPLNTALVGPEGMVGATLALGVELAPTRGVVQCDSSALRISASHLAAALADHSSLRDTLGRYLYLGMLQLSQRAGCARFHDVSARLGRSLLMAHDCSGRNCLHLTQQFLADMLGVQRGAVTLAAGLLQQRGLIRYSRGDITLLDRPGLTAIACECYGVGRRDYRRLMGGDG